MEWIVVIVVILVFLAVLGRRGGTTRAPASPARGGAPRVDPSRTGVTITYDGPRDPEATLGANEAAVGDRAWRSPGEQIDVRGTPIKAGLIYVGSGLAALNGYGAEPALIDPKLAADIRRPDWTGQGLDYWPAYSSIPPSTRGAYLTWLSAGRPLDPIPLGYAFLFFYGLERRVLVDARHMSHAAADVPLIRREVTRMLDAYRESASFHSYATALLGAIDALFPGPDAAPAELPKTSWEVPVGLRIQLGRLVAAGQPIPASVALGWALASPEVYLRTPATRCPHEFAALFNARYQAAHGAGLVVKEPRRRLEVHYRPASASFGGPVKLPIGDLPDVAGLSAPVARLRELVDASTDELDAYSRWIGRNPEQQGSLAAAALLPAELLATRQSQQLDELHVWLDQETGGRNLTTIRTDALLRHWPSAPGAKPGKADSVALAQLLGKLGYGIEPDVRFEGPTPDPAGAVVLFRQPHDAPAAPSAAYSAATVVARLGMTIAAADEAVSDEELVGIEAHLGGALELTPAESSRLDAHMHWLKAAAPTVSGLKKRVAHLTIDQRDELGTFLIAVAGADGQVGPAEVTALGRLYGMIGLDPQSVFTRVHGLATGSGSGPVGQAPGVARETGSVVSLDMERVQAKLHETRAVSALLSGVFVEDKDEATPVMPPSEPGIAGLDPAHSALLRRLAGRTSIARSEFEAVARTLGLLPDGALDTINDAAFDRVGVAITTGDDPIDVDTTALEEMLA